LFDRIVKLLRYLWFDYSFVCYISPEYPESITSFYPGANYVHVPEIVGSLDNVTASPAA